MFENMMRVISNKIMEETGNFICFSIHHIALLMSCSSEFTCPMTMISNYNILIFFQVFQKILLGIIKLLLIYFGIRVVYSVFNFIFRRVSIVLSAIDVCFPNDQHYDFSLYHLHKCDTVWHF